MRFSVETLRAAMTEFEVLFLRPSAPPSPHVCGLFPPSDNSGHVFPCPRCGKLWLASEDYVEFQGSWEEAMDRLRGPST
jgi:predicted RNA-binding Zn-ribbon protein involved in translation (DUF1610 family)